MEPQNKIAQLRTAQIKWISIRDQCQDEKCIREAYISRLIELFRLRRTCRASERQLGGNWRRISKYGDYISFSLDFVRKKTNLYSYTVAPEHIKENRLENNWATWDYVDCEVLSGEYVEHGNGGDKYSDPGDDLKILRYDEASKTLYLLGGNYFSIYRKTNK